MAVAVYQARGKQVQHNQEPSAIDTIMKGLQIASSVYGIKHGIDQNELNKLAIQKNTADIANTAEMRAKEASNVANLENPQYQENVLGRKLYEQTTGINPGETSTLKSLGTDSAALYAKAAEQQKSLQSQKASEASQGRLFQQQENILAQKAKKDTLTQGQVAVDKDFAKNFSEWNLSGGNQGAMTKIAALEDAKQKLIDNPNLTGPAKLSTSGTLGEILNPETIQVKDQVLQAIQSTLRQTLGSQFTEKEGENIFKRAWNDRLPAEKNIEKIEATIMDLKSRAAATNAASKYFEQNGTMRGFIPGTSSVSKQNEPKVKKDFGMADYLTPKANAASSRPPIMQNGVEFNFNPKNGKYE